MCVPESSGAPGTTTSCKQHINKRAIESEKQQLFAAPNSICFHQVNTLSESSRILDLSPLSFDFCLILYYELWLNSGHLGQSSSNHAAPNTDPLPLDSVAGLSEVPEPVQVQEPNLHGALPGLPQEVDIVIQAPELLPGYMEVLAVLNSRRSMSSLLDALVRLVPVLEFVRPARGALHTIMECCKDSMAPGEITGMVYAPAVLEAVCIFFACIFCAFFELDWQIIDSFFVFCFKSSGQ